MSISFFGASVTIQEEGYTHFFKNLYLKEHPNEHIWIHGYGSMHLFDAGIIFIDEVIQNKPMYCFIDWFSTGFIFTNSSQLIYLDTILYKLNQIKCIPIILFLDRNPMEDKRKEMFELVKKYLDQHNINYIDLVQQFDSSKILRDCIHTNSKGSELYGTYIFEKFTNIYKNNLHPYPLLDIIQSNKFCSIKKLIFKRQINKEIIFEGNGTIMGIYQSIGPHSTKCKIKETGQIIPIFDEWCHYDRLSIKICNMIIDGIMTIQLENSDMKELYDKCRKQQDWTTIDKHINIEFISYIGNISIKHYE